MYKHKKVIITICARGGSKGLRGKNTRLLGGKPLIWYTIDQAKQLSWVDRIVISTDSPEIRNIAIKNGVEAPFLRPKNSSTAKAPKIPAIVHAINKAEEIWHEKYDISIDLSVTSPIRDANDIKNCINILLKYKAKTVFSVTLSKDNPFFNMVKVNKEGFADLFSKKNKQIVRRQDSPPVYSLNGSIYVAWVNVLRGENTYYTDKTRVYIMPSEKTIDIDKEIDFDFLKFLIKEKKIKL